MTEKEILGLSVNKAQNTGYILPSAGIAWDLIEGHNPEVDPTVIAYIIFSHDFAKAFWGEKEIATSNDMCGFPSEFTPAWQYHLALMVLEKEPLKYLEKFLDE